MTAELIHLRAPAKVNLSLAVLGRRDDGFHEIESWVALLDWHDELVVSGWPGRFEFTLRGGGAAVPGDETNLVFKAANALGHAAKREPTGRIELVKRLPVGAGLGGGSSDAAAALRGLNEVWGLQWSPERLAEVGAGVGSDVPLFLCSGQSVIRGRGERVEGIHSGWSGWGVLVLPHFSLRTSDVYQRWKLTRRSTLGAEPWVTSAGSAANLMGRLFNDLEAAAEAAEPLIGELRRELSVAGERPVRMTGSGSCLFTLADDKADAAGWAALVASVLAGRGTTRIVRVSAGECETRDQ